MRKTALALVLVLVPTLLLACSTQKDVKPEPVAENDVPSSVSESITVTPKNRRERRAAPPPPPPVSPVAKDASSGVHESITVTASAPASLTRAEYARMSVAGGVVGGLVGGSVVNRGPMPHHTEEYGTFEENPFLRPTENPLSTFAIDVDRASYANVRRFLREGVRPPKDAIRIEELVNYFTYDYPEPSTEPFSITTELSACPWNAKHKLLLVGLKGKSIRTRNLPPSNLVFLIDSSGSMMSHDKLPLVKAGLRLLVDQLRPEDRVAIVTYAGSAGLVLESTPGSQKGRIIEAIDRLEAGGSTAGAAGIHTAYDVARRNFDRRGNNRVILATDGDFNVGVTSDGELESLIEEKRRDGIFLTVLGFGTGNIKDSKMELLANKGNGNYSYIDSLAEARKTLVHEMGATLFTIAKDVKIQVEFNPARVGAYRLIGYENRLLQSQDFNDDKKDAGELGAGHSVTALYEIIPPGVEAPIATVDPLKYQKPAGRDGGSEVATVKLRYKEPDGDTSRLLSRVVGDNPTSMSDNLRLAASVAEFGMILRDSPHKGEASLQSAEELAISARVDRHDLLAMIGQAKGLM